MTSPTPVDVSGAPVRRPGETGKTGTYWQPGMNRQNQPGGFGPHPGGGVQITISGPVLEGRVSTLIAAMIEEMRYRLAAQGLSNVQRNLDRSIRHPTPYYETQIMVERSGVDWTVHDRKIIYGMWLEGLSHRNTTTRFKGYHSFLRATEELQHQAPAILANVAGQFVDQMNSG
jgi:hypothetical protein